MTSKGERRSLAGAYVAGEADAVELVGGHFGDAERWAAAVRDAGPLHDSARKALHAQNASGPDSEARCASLRAIDDEGTVMVVTGQQPGLFGGPLLAYLKAASAVTLARRVEREHGARCVPVFWVQSEDHDFDEIAEHVWLDGSGALGSARIAAAAPVVAANATLSASEQDRVPLEHRVLGDDVGRCLDALETGLAGTLHGGQVVRTVRRAYAADAGLAEAFAALLSELFAEAGLLVLRPRSPGIAQALSSLHVQCVERMADIEDALRHRASELQRCGFGAQVPVREGAALAFFHPDGALGPRYRIVRAEGGGDALSLAGRDDALTRDDLLAAAEREPLRFSTSALLRPIAQDHLLPTVAYVGGPSELAYFAQLPPLYDAFEMRPPVIVPRLSARWMDAEARALLAGRSVDDESLADDGPIARELGSAASGFDLDGLVGRLHDAVAGELEAARPKLEALDPGLAKACDKTEATARDAGDKLVRRATRAALSRAPDGRARLARLRAMLRPRGEPQERVLGWTSIAARLGLDRLRETALGFDPLEPGTRDIADE
ncbi:MAG: bacillithiol biosynthesis cysteine-adding enzyme BshC [Polyangiales bacterium]